MYWWIPKISIGYLNLKYSSLFKCGKFFKKFSFYFCFKNWVSFSCTVVTFKKPDFCDELVNQWDRLGDIDIASLRNFRYWYFITLCHIKLYMRKMTSWSLKKKIQWLSLLLNSFLKIFSITLFKRFIIKKKKIFSIYFGCDVKNFLKSNYQKAKHILYILL